MHILSLYLNDFQNYLTHLPICHNLNLYCAFYHQDLHMKNPILFLFVRKVKKNCYFKNVFQQNNLNYYYKLKAFKKKKIIKSKLHALNK